MCHFFANPLSILLVDDKDKDATALTKLQREHIEAIRHLPSFRKYVRTPSRRPQILILLDTWNALWKTPILRASAC